MEKILTARCRNGISQVPLDTRDALLPAFTALSALLGTSHATDNGLTDLVSYPGSLMVNGSRVFI